MLEATERVLHTKDWITYLLLLVFTLFVIIKYHHSERLTRLFSLILSRNYLVIYSKHTPLVLNSFHLFFALIQLFIFSITIFIGIKTNSSIAKEFEFSFFLSIVTGVFIFTVLRYFLGKLLAILFDLEKEHESLTYLKMSYLSNFCLLIFPFLIFTLYLFYDSSLAAIMIVSIAVFILLLFYVLIIKNNQKLILKNFFYFILYLCALEVAPLIFFYKLFII